jgi:2,5-furandicarboxylate decarboxylase 1
MGRKTSGKSDVDFDRYRLRNFVDHLDGIGELEVHEEPVHLSDLSAIIEASDKAVLFENAGPEGFDLVANVSGSRARLAAALGVDVDGVVEEFERRMANPQPVVDVPAGDAPVRQVILEGDDADLTRLPFHPQHALDGGTYISSAIDYVRDPATGITNVGCRRLSLRGPKEAGTNVTAPSDLQRIYRGCVARGERLPINFAIGCHPVDFMAAGLRIPADEVTLVATLRGTPMPLTKGVTNDAPVPADAEMVIEGYLDERGYIEPEGPYGEYMGYYGPMHMDPIFHVTAITMREDVMHQSLLHGSGKQMNRAESANILAIRMEGQIRGILKGAGVDVAEIHVPAAAAEGQHVRISIRQGHLPPAHPGQARNVILAVFASMMMVKHVFVTDDDVDIRSEHDMDWAMASRFHADRDLIVQSGMLGMPLNPTIDIGEFGPKAGFDLTMPVRRRGRLTSTVAGAPVIAGEARYQSVEQALQSAPLHFTEIMEALGSRDGREIAVQLNQLRDAGKLIRDEFSRYMLGQSEAGRTTLTERAVKETY